jgi:hypothetical protein
MADENLPEVIMNWLSMGKGKMRTMKQLAVP